MKTHPIRKHIDGTKRTFWEGLADLKAHPQLYIGIVAGALFSAPVWFSVFLSLMGGQI